MGKKKIDLMRKVKVDFVEGAIKHGGAKKEVAEKFWEQLEEFANYCFNKSHAACYGLIAYWTAYLKAHYPLEFAAANLRNAKDEDGAVALLREMVKEGIEYLPFDVELSEKNWSVKDGKLVGGFMALKGIGESKAEKLIEARNSGKLTDKQRQTILDAENVFNDIFPFRTKYGHIYDEPAKNGVAGNLTHIEKLVAGLPQGSERVFIGELIHKDARNANEGNEIKKRGGKIETGQLEFLDVKLRDDTGSIAGRIGRKDYLQIGIPLLQNVPIGAHLLIRARFYNGFRFAFITKWKRLDA